MNPSSASFNMWHQPMQSESLQKNQQKQTNRNLCFTIEGNIGCGKSTFLALLRQKCPQIKWIEQPVDEWQNLGQKNINMLERYYKQPKRWGFTFQIYAIFTRIKKMQQACQRFPNHVKISERSILADKHVFAELMKDLDYMQTCEYEVYKCLYQNFEKSTNISQTKIIYLKCSPQTCYERTKSRKRPEQAQIPLQYLKMIHQKHQKWFDEYDQQKVLVINTDNDFKHNQETINDMLETLKSFIYEGSKKDSKPQALQM